MVATVGLGRLLGVDREMTLLIAAWRLDLRRFSAVAAMNAVSRADEEEVGCCHRAWRRSLGTVAMLGVPLAGFSLGLPEAQTGLWAERLDPRGGPGGGRRGGPVGGGAEAQPAGRPGQRVVMLAPTVAAPCRFLRGGTRYGPARCPGAGLRGGLPGADRRARRPAAARRALLSGAGSLSTGAARRGASAASGCGSGSRALRRRGSPAAGARPPVLARGRGRGPGTFAQRARPRRVARALAWSAMGASLAQAARGG
ncbi:MAG: hypothetical protein WKG07_36025 [Hymenobacter sp.]